MYISVCMYRYFQFYANSAARQGSMYLFICIHMHLCTYINTHTYIHICMYTCIHINIYKYAICIHIYVQVCICINMCMCTLCTWLYVYVCMYIHEHYVCVLSVCENMQGNNARAEQCDREVCVCTCAIHTHTHCNTLQHLPSKLLSLHIVSSHFFCLHIVSHIRV